MSVNIAVNGNVVFSMQGHPPYSDIDNKTIRKITTLLAKLDVRQAKVYDLGPSKYTVPVSGTYHVGSFYSGKGSGGGQTYTVTLHVIAGDVIQSNGNLFVQKL